jgi:large conductance mechanosensitive channel
MKKIAFNLNIAELIIVIIVGLSLSGIFTSLVNDIVMPLLGLLIGGNVKDLSVIISQATANHTEISLNYGLFIQNVIGFIVIVVCLLFSVYIYRRLFKKKENNTETKPEFTEHDLLHYEIVELLKEIRNNTKSK